MLIAALPGASLTRADVDALLERVPAGSVAVVTWEGFNDDDEAFAGSRFKAMLDDTDLTQRWSKVFNAIGEKAAQENDQDAQTWADLTAVLPVLWRSSAVAYFGGVDFADAVDEPGQPRTKPAVSFGILIEAGDHAEHFRAFFTEMHAELSSDSDLRETLVTVVDEAGLIGIQGRKSNAPAPASIQTDARYTQAFDDGDATRHASMYVDFPAFIKVVRDSVEFDNGPDDLVEFDKVVQRVGVDGLGRFAWSSGFVDTQWQSTMILEAPAPRRGFVKLLDQGQLDKDILKRTTRGTTWARAFRFDALGSYDTVIETLHSVMDQSDIDNLQGDLDEMNRAAGFNVRDDLLAHIGADWMVYTDTAFGGMFGTGLAAIHGGIRDADALNARLLQLQALFNREGQRNGMPFQWTDMDMGDVTIHTLPIPVFSPSWAIDDGRLIFANSPQSVVTATLAAKDKTRSIENSDAFATVAPQLQPADEDPRAKAGVMVVDTVKTAATIYQSITMGAAMVGGEFERELGFSPIQALPPLAKITPHLGPAGSVSWLDDAGYHAQSRMPFPMATSLSPEVMLNNSGPSMVAMGIGITLPALGAARNTAREMQGMSNMRQVLIAMLTYAADHNERFPATLDQLGPYLGGNNEVFHHPHDDHDGQAGIVPSMILILPGASIDAVEDPQNTIALIDRKDFNGDGRIAVGYADGHASMQPLHQANEQLQEQTGKTLEQWAGPALLLD